MQTASNKKLACCKQEKVFCKPDTSVQCGVKELEMILCGLRKMILEVVEWFFRRANCGSYKDGYQCCCNGPNCLVNFLGKN